MIETLLVHIHGRCAFMEDYRHPILCPACMQLTPGMTKVCHCHECRWDTVRVILTKQTMRQRTTCILSKACKKPMAFEARLSISTSYRKRAHEGNTCTEVSLLQAFCRIDS